MNRKFYKSRTLFILLAVSLIGFIVFQAFRGVIIIFN
jgi:hypothetical protein